MAGLTTKDSDDYDDLGFYLRCLDPNVATPALNQLRSHPESVTLTVAELLALLHDAILFE